MEGGKEEFGVSKSKRGGLFIEALTKRVGGSCIWLVP